MPRIRSVKPEFFSDRKLARLLSRDARLLYIAMWNQADEHGRLQGDPRFIKGACVPYDDDIDLDRIEELLTEIEGARRARRYEQDGDPYIFLPKLASHQRLEPDKVPSRLPAPPPESDSYPTPNADADLSERCADESARDDNEKSLSYVAGSREQGASSRGAPSVPDDATPEDPTTRLLTEHAAAYNQPPPPSALIAVKREVMRLVAEGVEPPRIRAGLARLREKQLAASLLPQLVTEASQPRQSDNTRILAAARERAQAAEAQQRKAIG